MCNDEYLKPRFKVKIILTEDQLNLYNKFKSCTLNNIMFSENGVNQNCLYYILC